GRYRGSVKETRLYIPGSVIRGIFGLALARLVCREPSYTDNHSGCPSKDSCPYFLLYMDGENKSPRIFFKHAYPVHRGCGGIFVQAPFNLYACRCGGTKLQSFDPLVEERICDRCGSELKRYSGYICSSCGELSRVPVRISRAVRTAVDRSTSSSAISFFELEGLSERIPFGYLYAVESVSRGDEYMFSILLSRDVSDLSGIVVRVLEEVLSDEGIGGGRSRGFGCVDIRVESISDVTEEEVERRAKNIDGERFTVTFTSDAFIESIELRSETLLAAARRAYTWIFRVGAPTLPEVKLERYTASMGVMGGWSLKENRRRVIQPVVKAGSIYLYSSSGGERLAEALAALEYLGLGGYKAHGFGQVRIGGG
ncbi:MAG: hypothetical protein N3E44_00065, partial [Candidatus Bathyarchaeota archaeon]|nr:hypothetical protein [Candidatus Bathyarchaeota archaeon]